MSKKPEATLAAEALSFKDLLHKGTFEVPWHQRRYDWKKAHVEELLEDIHNAVKSQRDCYFIGTIMLVKTGDRHWEINDGQQRMVTISLVCAALCRRFHDESKGHQREGSALRIVFDLGSNGGPWYLDKAESYTPRISPPKDNETLYRQMIRGRSVAADGAMRAAWNTIAAFFSKMSQEEIGEYFDFIVDNIKVVSLEVSRNIDTNAVYETINHRGKQLDEFDLIRNHIYSFFKSDIKQEKRITIHSALESIGTHFRSTEKSSQYMRCYLQCEFGFLRKQSFYNDFKRSLYAEEEFPADYVFDLVNKMAAPEYRALFDLISASSPDEEYLNKFVTDSGKRNSPRNLSVFLRELHDYKVSHPLVFAMLRLYLDERGDRGKKKMIARMVQKNLNRLTTFIMRTAFVASFRPSKFESSLAKCAKKITEAKNISDNKFIAFLKDCDKSTGYGVLNDKEFKKALAEVRMSGRKKTIQFFLGVNRSMQRDTSILKGDYDIEHILPVSAQHHENWKGFEGAEPESWVNRLGNLTLLAPNDNKPGKKFNDSFAKKCESYRESSLKITRDLADIPEWTPAEIEKRQREMAKAAVKVWEFK